MNRKWLREGLTGERQGATKELHFSDLTDEERDFLSGSRDDLILARSFAMQLSGDNPAKANGLMHQSESRAHNIISELRKEISLVAEDIIAFALHSENPDSIYYSAKRAEKLIQQG